MYSTHQTKLLFLFVIGREDLTDPLKRTKRAILRVRTSEAQISETQWRARNGRSGIKGYFRHPLVRCAFGVRTWEILLDSLPSFLPSIFL